MVLLRNSVIKITVLSNPTEPRRYFLEFLKYAAITEETNQVDEEIRNAVLFILCKSLSLDGECFGLIKSSYPRYLPQVNNLFKFISENWWKKGNSGLPNQTNLRQLFCEKLKPVIEWVIEVNAQLLAKTFQSDEGNTLVSPQPISEPNIEVSTTTCSELKKIFEVSPQGKKTEAEEGIGKARLFFLMMLIFLISNVWYYEIEIGTVRHFLKDQKAKWGL
eukprot:TRINITY_DN10870_c0_g1_i2.p1 TRINITY_DN10870_c0_g1~~TRINITY_DN10870_c0_g1_i2.p1  ORF type:complete len:219 (+),score=48.96 TRINITY_DN10870_c0_g1_i2:1182-1838(+)